MSDMIEPLIQEIVRQRQEERLTAGALARLARDLGDPVTERPDASRRLAGSMFGWTRARSLGARHGYPAGTDAGESS